MIAMATNLFNLQANLQLNITNFVNNITAAVTQGQNLATNLQTMTTRAVAMGQTLASWGEAAGNIVRKFGTELIESAADVQAENEAFASTFRDNLGEAEAVLQRISETNNIYYTRLKKTGTEMYSQFKAAGAGANSMTMMERALNVAADAAAFYNISLEEASRRVRSFIRGNVEGGDSIGLFVTEVERAEYASRLYEKAWKDLTEAERQNVLLARAEDAYRMSGAVGQAARESDHYTNVLYNLKEKWRQIQATLGAPIIDALGPVLDRFTKFLEDNPEIVDKFATSIGTLADALSSLAISFIEYAGNNSDKLVGIVDFFTGLLPRGLGLQGSGTDDGNGKGKFGKVADKLIGDIDFNALYADFAAMAEEYIRAYDAYYDAYYTNGEDTTDEKTRLDNAASALDRGGYSLDQFNYILGNLGINASDSAWRRNEGSSADIATALSAFASIPDEIKTAIANALGDITINVNIDGAGLSGAVDTTMGINNARGRYTTPAFSA